MKVKAHLPAAYGEDASMGRTVAALVLAQNLAELKKLAGAPRTQAEIAERAGVDQKTVSRIENATNATSVDKLDGLADAFRVQPWQLLVDGLKHDALPTLVSSGGAAAVAAWFQLQPADTQAVILAAIGSTVGAGAAGMPSVAAEAVKSQGGPAPGAPQSGPPSTAPSASRPRRAGKSSDTGPSSGRR